MSMFSSSRRKQHRRFDYEPRYYNPNRDDGIKRRMRIHSKTRRRRSPVAIIYFALLLMLVVYVYNLL
jgi:hypothetical protein